MYKMTYRRVGINYSDIDPIKILAQRQGLRTRSNLNTSPYKEVERSRGESAYIIEAHDCYIAFITEGLGSKNIIADEMRKITGKTYYDSIGYDSVVSIV